MLTLGPLILLACDSPAYTRKHIFSSPDSKKFSFSSPLWFSSVFLFYIWIVTLKTITSHFFAFQRLFLFLMTLKEHFHSNQSWKTFLVHLQCGSPTFFYLNCYPLNCNRTLLYFPKTLPFAFTPTDFSSDHSPKTFLFLLTLKASVVLQRSSSHI